MVVSLIASFILVILKARLDSCLDMILAQGLARDLTQGLDRNLDRDLVLDLDRDLDLALDLDAFLVLSLATFRSFVGSLFSEHFVLSANKASSLALCLFFLAVRAGSTPNVIMKLIHPCISYFS